MSDTAKINKLVVIGLGLIGGSLASALKQNHAVSQVIGIARRKETCRRAVELSIVDRAYTELTDIANELGKGDCIFIAVPTLSIEEVLRQIKTCIADSVTITDGASVKGSVRQNVLDVFGYFPPQVVLAHPIAGSEKSGVEAANPDLYKNHRVIITPLKENTQDHLNRVSQMWKTSGADVIEMDVDDHDIVLASTSHLPHAIAFSLVDTLAHDSQNENIFRYAAGGFRDFTRIASSDATMWRDIMLANKEAVIKSIDLFSDNLQRLKSAIEDEDTKAITGVFTRAKVARDRFTKMLAHMAYSKQQEQKKIDFIAKPGETIAARLCVPGDKSICHRAIMLGSLANGITTIEGFLESEDALATLQAFRDMGVVIEGPDQGRVTINGVGLNGLEAPSGALYVGNSGTSMRLLSGILAGQTFDSEIIGDTSLMNSAMQDVINPLLQMGAKVSGNKAGLPPIKISGEQTLNGIEFTLAHASAQVKSCILLASLYAKDKTIITEPHETRDHTEQMLRGFGCEVKHDENKITMQPGCELQAMKIHVPGDFSLAVYLIVATLIAEASEITLSHVGVNPTRTVALDILKSMGANITLKNQQRVSGEPVADIVVKASSLHGIDISEKCVATVIDDLPAILIAAAFASGKTVLKGANVLQSKQRDRIKLMAEGLITLGIQAISSEDGIIIEGGTATGGAVDSGGDHRVAMAFTVSALKVDGEIRVINCASVLNSYPNFTDQLKTAGISLEVINT